MDRTPLCFYSSEQLMEKVALAVEGSYLKSSRYAELREALKRRLRIVEHIIKFRDAKWLLHSEYQKITADYEEFQAHIIWWGDYQPVHGVDTNYTTFMKFMKKLKKRLQTSLNNLDKAWGYYGLMGYGMNYGYNHIEMGGHK